MSLIQEIKNTLKKLGDKRIAQQLQRFFKTGKGEYGEGDKFLGIRVPVLRKLINKYKDISIDEIVQLLNSEYHEERMLSILMLVDAFSKGGNNAKRIIYMRYLDNIKYINNWDLVDCSAPYIVGAYLLNSDRQPLYEMAVSKVLWDRRIAIISTFHFIKRNEFDDTLNISEISKSDKEDLIHKAVGWMLREVGKRNLKIEEEFLKKHYKNMPRTMLRYAIEKFNEDKRQKYLKGTI